MKEMTPVSRTNPMPLAMLQRDGRIAHASGQTVWIQQPAAADLESSVADQYYEDITFTIQRRAMLQYSMDVSSNIKLFRQEELQQQQQRVALAATTTADADAASPSVVITRNRFLRLWVWIQQVETLCSRSLETADDPMFTFHHQTPKQQVTWQDKGLIDAGTVRILVHSEKQNHLETSCQVLGCPIYDGPGRRAALAALGWTTTTEKGFQGPPEDTISGTQSPLFNKAPTVSAMMDDQKEQQEFEQSAIFAVWCGEFGRAAGILREASDFMRTATRTDPPEGQGDVYADLLERVSSLLATESTNDESTKVQLVECQDTLSKCRFRCRASVHVAYLKALVQFLLTMGDPNKRREQVLKNRDLHVSDRAIFACRFLPMDKLKEYLIGTIRECQDTGNVEGLVLTGMDRVGIRILQSFVDQTADVQTAALITSRVVLPPSWEQDRKIVSEWLDSYRSLLNSFQLWHIRAMLDVERAKVLRKDKSSSNSHNSQFEASGGGSHHGGSILLRSPQNSMVNGTPLHTQQQQQHLQMGRPGGGVAGSGSATAARARLLHAQQQQHHHHPQVRERSGNETSRVGCCVDCNVPPLQLDARCNFCSKPLMLKNTKDGAIIGKLSKMKPVLSCCPHCRKPLPRCAVCMLPLGIVNPCCDLIRRMSSSSSSLSSPPKAGNNSSASTPTHRTGYDKLHYEDMSSTQSLPLAEWFTWCRRCKHGGHAHHIMGWFANRSVCPVSGCECRCRQIDHVPLAEWPLAFLESSMSSSSSSSHLPVTVPWRSQCKE